LVSKRLRAQGSGHGDLRPKGTDCLPIAMYFFTIDVTVYIKKSPLLLKEGWPSDVRRMAGVVD